jgi:site-specific DNA recombinase
VHYDGAHEPLVDPGTWQQVQDLLAAHNQAGTHQRTNLHYLRGSVYCGSCGSRLMLVTARNRWDTTYRYLICSGRARKTTGCQRRAMAVDLIEELIEDEYRTIALPPELRDNIEELVLEDFDALQEVAASERHKLEAQQTTLTAQRQKLLDAHYAGAIPLDLLKTEQDRIAIELAHIQQQLGAANDSYEQARANLAECLDLTRDCHTAYLQAPDITRRLFNQAFFSRIYILEDGDAGERTVSVDYNPPFDELLARLVPAHVHHDLQEAEHKQQRARRDAPAGSVVPGTGIAGVQGSHTDTLVELRGFEPLTPSMRTRCATGLRYSPKDQAPA